MRVLILGGTLFIGRRIARELLARGDDVMVVHRGQTEPAELSGCAHVHAARSALAESPVRSERYPLRALLPGLGEHYDKLDVEPLYLSRGGTARPRWSRCPRTSYPRT